MKLPIGASVNLNSHMMNPEIEKARKELEKLKQREHELQERLSAMYASAGDTYVEEEGEVKKEEGEVDKCEDIYENVYNAQYIQNGHTQSNKNYIKDPWIDDSKIPHSSILDHRGNSYSALARAVTDKRAIIPVTIPNRKSDTEEVVARYPYPAKKKNENSSQQPSAMMDNLSTDGEVRDCYDSENNKHEISSSYIPEDSDFEEHLFYHAYEERASDHAVDYYSKNGELSSSEFDDEVVDHRNEIHREIKINQQRERELRYERNMLSDGSETSSNSDSESVVSALSIRSKILKEIEEERLRDMEIQDQYRMRGLIRPLVKVRTASTATLDDATSPKHSNTDEDYMKNDVHRHECVSGNVIDLTGGGDASLRSKDNDGTTQQQLEHLKRLQRVLIDDGEDTGDSASELSESIAVSNIDMRSRILKEIEEEQKREKELKTMMKRIARRGGALIMSSMPNYIPASINVDQPKSLAGENAKECNLQNTSNARVQSKHRTSDLQHSQNTVQCGNMAQCISKHNKTTQCTPNVVKDTAQSMSKGVKNTTQSTTKNLNKTTQCMSTSVKNTTQGTSTGSEPTQTTVTLITTGNNDSARSLNEIDRCIFSSREDLVAFLGTEEDNEEDESEPEVQPLKIPKVFTSNTTGYQVLKITKSPMMERKVSAQVVEPAQTKPISSVNNISNGIPMTNKKNKSEQNGNKSSVYFETEHQYMNTSYDDELKDFEKPAKKISRSSKSSKKGNKDEVKGSNASGKLSSEATVQRFSKPVTVSFTISKTIQRWERRIKKNSQL